MFSFFSRTACVLAGALLAFSLAPPAGADIPPYWSYWESKGQKWSTYQVGPAQAKPKDGAVEGWRFTKPKGQKAAEPRPKPSFDTICGKTKSQSGSKRVGLVIDFGTAADSPQGGNPPKTHSECALVPKDANGMAVLTQVVKPQTEASGLICEIASYPSGACGAGTKQKPAAQAPAAKKKPDDDEGSNTGLYTGIVLIVAVAAVGVFAVARRRRSAQ